MTETLAEIAELVHRASGIVVRPHQYAALAASVARVGPEGDADAFLRRAADPVGGPVHVARLLDEVTVKETFFLRELEGLARIEWQRLLGGARDRGAESLRIWSAACATGEEAYTLALLACEAFGTDRPPVTILATDISRAALDAARAGRYRPRSTRELDEPMRRRYFSQEEDVLVVGSTLRALVRFELHNLATDPAPPHGAAPFDLILCRNVLIYFDLDVVDRVTTALERALVPDGQLLLGAADTLCRGASRLRELAFSASLSVPLNRPPARTLRRPLGRQPAATAAGPSRVAEAAAAPEHAEVVARTAELIAEDALNADAHLLRGLADLERGDAEAAVASLRRALYAEPRFGLAAFQLGRAYEALGDRSAARRAYEQALRTCTDDDLHEGTFSEVGLADLIGAARTRLDALAAVGFGS
jgi:chemotaxis protein methyltransferase CheR